MNHISPVSRGIPALAASPVEVAGMFQKLQILAGATTATFGTLTAGVNFYNLIANPPREITNGQKGL
ncbi:MAG: hypothetical protein HZB26_03175 [Candidatus Hydrogenedentes bacterium]|nr:hypothetical protein [Candidatus Hydrogenedentota bacterium]